MSLAPQTFERLRPPLRIVLPSGQKILVCKAGPEDRDKLRAFYESLTPETIYSRFLHIVKDFTRYVELVLGPLNKYGVVLLAYDEKKGLEKPVAVAEVFSKEGIVGEVAVTVHEEYRGRGIGTILVILAVLEAYHNGIRRIEAYVLADNIAALRIARKMGMKLAYTGSGVYHAIVEIEEAAPKALQLLTSFKIEKIT
ncbi:MAG: GNAT family N-acetyltransferase [Pyrodictiaceae archaeon]